MATTSPDTLPFRWGVVRALLSPGIEAGEAPAGLLAPVERVVFDRLRFVRRRRKWLLGRWAAKSLLQEIEMERTGNCPDASSFFILNDPSGSPYAAREAEGRLPISLSISHRANWGAAGLCLDPTVSLGIDLETVESRGADWCSDYFVANEMEAVRAAGDARDRVVARIWSVKESALKALGVGLRMDTRRIEVREAHEQDDGRSALAGLGGWTPLDVRMDSEILQVGEAVRAYSMDCADFVLTAVLLTRSGA